jgi:SAM-dependent methyltransferase
MQTIALLLLLASLILFSRYFLGVGIGAPWLPLRRRDIPDGFSLVDIKPGSVVIDLGSGDGRLLAEAAARGATVIGYELNPILVWWSRRKLAKYGSRATIFRSDLLAADLAKADTIFIFGITSIMPAVAKKLINECRPGATMISFAFEIPGLKVDATRGIAMRYIR